MTSTAKVPEAVEQQEAYFEAFTKAQEAQEAQEARKAIEANRAKVATPSASPVLYENIAEGRHGANDCSDDLTLGLILAQLQDDLLEYRCLVQPYEEKLADAQMRKLPKNKGMWKDPIYTSAAVSVRI